jgi:NAD(P)-dependent dehydrogenase (short-subunit alcohol dehydrogenase family)
MKLEQKTALVTGGARGIGAGIARCLAGEGARVAIVDIDGPEAEKTAGSLPGDGFGMAADVSQEDEITAAIEAVARELGGLDALVNNAGAATGREDISQIGGPSVATQTQVSWDSHLANNLRTTFLASKAAIPALKARGGGTITNIASIAGLMPSPTLPAYGAAKAAVIHLTRTLALELAPDAIRVNVICPGLLWTRAWEGLAALLKATVPEYGHMEPRNVFLEIVKRRVPLGREQTPEDIGKLVAFLASDDACNITGQELAVDGGITLTVGS